MSRLGFRACIPALSLFALACGSTHDPSLISASGHVEATDVRISTKVGGKLEWFPIEEGSWILPQQELARIDTTDIRLALRQAQADSSLADAELRLRLAGFREEDVAAGAAQVSQVEADLTGAQKDLERTQALLDSEIGAMKDRDDALSRRDAAAARLDAARDNLRKLRAGNRPEEIETARARLAAAEARIAQLEQQVSDATVTSPTRGIVTEKIAQQGELLAPGASLAVITDLDHAWLTVYIGEPDLARIRIGQEADVLTDDGQTRKGKVTLVSSKAEFTPKNVQTREERVKLVYEVRIGLDNRDGLFKPGMPAEARLRAAQPAR